MKKPLLVFLVGLAIASPFTAKAAQSAQTWLETYYIHPQPARTPAAFQALSREGYFDRPGNIPIAIGFFATVFAQNRDRVDHWLLEISSLPLRHHRLLAVALWQ